MSSYVIKHIPSGQYVYNDISSTAGMIIFTNNTILAVKYTSFSEAQSKIHNEQFEVEELKDDNLIDMVF